MMTEAQLFKDLQAAKREYYVSFNPAMGRQDIESLTSDFMEAFKAFKGFWFKTHSDNQPAQVQVGNNAVGSRSRLKQNDQHCLGKTNGVKQTSTVLKRKTSLLTGPASHDSDLFPAITRTKALGNVWSSLKRHGRVRSKPLHRRSA